MNILQHNIDGNSKNITGVGQFEADTVQGLHLSTDGSQGLTGNIYIDSVIGHTIYKQNGSGNTIEHHVRISCSRITVTIKSGIIVGISSSSLIYDLVYKIEQLGN